MNQIKLFETKQVRTEWDKKHEKWFFSVVDVCGILTDQPTQRGASNYWAKLKERMKDEEGADELLTNCQQLKLLSSDGKKYMTDVLDTKGILRLVQSIPSPKAEPFKMWLAHVGNERIEEIQDPEIAYRRIEDWYRQKGYGKDWIAKRLKGMETRVNLTAEWQERGIETARDYAILTAETSKATFGMVPSEYKEYKNLENKKDNLRDHMTELELIFTMLGEASTREIAQQKEAQGMKQNKDAARRGGEIAGNAREELEQETGTKVVSRENNMILQKDNKNILKRDKK